MKGEMQMTKTWIETIIKRGNYNKESLLKKMDAFLLNDRITEEDYKELVALMG